jgi:hypothetical protein
MIKRTRLAWLSVLALAVAGVAAAATDATRQEIYAAAQAGRLAEAQQMIDQVLRDYPQSAPAHFIAAELDARSGDFATARQQLATARQLDPTQRFASAHALSELDGQLSGARAFVPVVHRSAVPWGLIAVLVVAGFVLLSFLRGRARQAYAQGYGPGMLPPGNPGMQPGYGYGPGYPPQGGPGLMGNLASGLAVGAGVVAGEELVRHMIGGNAGDPGVASAGEVSAPPQNQDMGGTDFGTPDGSSWGGDSGGGDSGGWGGDSGGGGDWS